MEWAGSTCDHHAHAVLCSATACLPIVLKAPLLAAVLGTPEAWADLMKRDSDTLAAGEATPVPEEEV